MFLIGICDDSEEEREYIKQMCERCFAELGQACEFRCFASGEGVLSYSGQRMHLLFFDVEMGQTDGIQVLRALEDTDRVWRVVFKRRKIPVGRKYRETAKARYKQIIYTRMRGRM